MGWSRRVAPVVSAIALGATLLSACGGADEADRGRNATAATIGDRVISQAAVERSIDVLLPHPGGYARAFGPPRYAACKHAKRAAQGVRRLSAAEIQRQCKLEFQLARGQALSYLVRAEWVAREAQRRGIGAAERPREVAALRARTARRQDALLRTIDIGEAAIARYGHANAAVYGDPEQRVVHIVQATSARRARAARAHVEHGGEWAQAANRYGIKPLAQHWSGTHTVRASTAPQDAFGHGMFASRVGQLRGPVETLNGWFVFQVARVAHRGSNRLSARSRLTILHALRSQRLADELHARYAPLTTCARQYRIPEVPECR